MLDSASSLITPRPLPLPTASHRADVLLPLTILTAPPATHSKQLGDVLLPCAFSLSIATTRCPSTASTSSPRDCQSAYSDLFSPPSAVGPLSPLQLPATAKRATSAACRSLHFHDNWLTQTVAVVDESVQPPASAVLPAANSGKRHNRRDKAKRRSRSAQRHPHSHQQQQKHTDDIDGPAAPLASHTTYNTAHMDSVGRWEQLCGGEILSSSSGGSDDDECEGGLERPDISRAFVFSDLY